jgi:hypothetical protein
MRILAWVFVICTVAAGACAFDTSGAPTSDPGGGGAGDVDAATVSAAPDARVVDARPGAPDACSGKMCDGDKGPGK